MQRRDFLKTIPLLSLSPLAVGKFVPIGAKKKLILARSIPVSVYGVSSYMAGKITRSPNGDWLFKADDSRMRTVKIGDVQVCLPGWSISMSESSRRQGDRAGKSA